MTDEQPPADFPFPPPDSSRMRFWNAKRRGGMCGRCGRTLADGEPVYRKRISMGYCGGGAFQTMIAPLCRDCDGATDKEWHSSLRSFLNGPPGYSYYWSGPCETCGRTIYEGEFRYHRTHHYCCDDCAGRGWSSRSAVKAKKQRTEARGPSRPCSVCGEHFETSRADAQYCSPACRQKAYRRRVTNDELEGAGTNSVSVTTDVTANEVRGA
jgi:hypothetical protein